LITGGKRIGAVVAQRLAGRGMDVVLAYNRSSAEAEATAAAIRSAGRRAAAIRADLSHAADCAALVDGAAGALGRLDVLVNMASVYGATPLDDLGESHWDAALAVDVKAAFLCARAAVPHLRRAGGGRIINFSDWVAASGRPLEHARGPVLGGEGPRRLAEVGHVQRAADILPTGMPGRMVAHREQDLRVGLARRGRRPHGGGLRVEEHGGVACRPGVRLLPRRPDRRRRFLHARAPPGVVEPCGPDRGLAAVRPPAAGDGRDRFDHGLHVGQSLDAEPRGDHGTELVRRQSAPCRTYGWTIDPCGIVVCAIRFHPLSSTPRPRCASAIRVNGPITDSRPTLEAPSMMTPG